MVHFTRKAADEKYTFDDLYRLIELLRAPGGCPWDAVQTHETLIKPMLEEAYEAVDAIEKGSSEKLCEELGDVLLQVIFHSIIGNENGEFTFDDITDGCTRKMLFRHSHIFGEDKAETPDAVLSNWERKKNEEKQFRSLDEALRDVPGVFPSLLRAAKIAHKIRKQASQEEEAQAQAEDGAAVPHFTDSAEAGRFLYCAARQCERAGIDPELALKAYIEKEILHADR